MEVRETIRCRGHPNVISRHPTTFEITKDVHLTCQGDCIIGVGADKGAADLSPEFRAALSRDDAVLSSMLTCGNISVLVISRGSSEFVLDHPTDLVWRGFVGVVQIFGLRDSFKEKLLMIFCEFSINNK